MRAPGTVSTGQFPLHPLKRQHSLASKGEAPLGLFTRRRDMSSRESEGERNNVMEERKRKWKSRRSLQSEQGAPYASAQTVPAGDLPSLLVSLASAFFFFRSPSFNVDEEERDREGA